MIKNNTQINLRGLSKIAATLLFKEAKVYAQSRWSFELIDCRWSFVRQKLNVRFEDVLEAFNRLKGVPVAFYRTGIGDDYLEIGFYTLEEPTYYLFMNVPLENASTIEALIQDLKK